MLDPPYLAKGRRILEKAFVLDNSSIAFRPCAGLTSYLELKDNFLKTFGPTCWINFGMIGRQPTMMPIASSAHPQRPMSCRL